MRGDDILRLLRVEPFRPFRLAMSDGSKFDVEHPQLAIVEPLYVTLGIPGPRGPDAPCERIVHFALRHINTVEFMKSARRKSST